MKGKGLPDRKLRRKKLFKLKYSLDTTSGPQTSLYGSQSPALRMSFRPIFPTSRNCLHPRPPYPRSPLDSLIITQQCQWIHFRSLIYCRPLTDVLSPSHRYEGLACRHPMNTQGCGGGLLSQLPFVKAIILLYACDLHMSKCCKYPSGLCRKHTGRSPLAPEQCPHGVWILLNSERRPHVCNCGLVWFFTPSPVKLDWFDCQSTEVGKQCEINDSSAYSLFKMWYFMYCNGCDTKNTGLW